MEELLFDERQINSPDVERQVSFLVQEAGGVEAQVSSITETSWPPMDEMHNGASAEVRAGRMVIRAAGQMEQEKSQPLVMDDSSTSLWVGETAETSEGGPDEGVGDPAEGILQLLEGGRRRGLPEVSAEEESDASNPIPPTAAPLAWSNSNSFRASTFVAVGRSQHYDVFDTRHDVSFVHHAHIITTFPHIMASVIIPLYLASLHPVLP